MAAIREIIISGKEREREVCPEGSPRFHLKNAGETPVHPSLAELILAGNQRWWLTESSLETVDQT